MFCDVYINIYAKNFRDKGYAERLFSELPPSPRSYSALIMGMVKYFQVFLLDFLMKHAAPSLPTSTSLNVNLPIFFTGRTSTYLL